MKRAWWIVAWLAATAVVSFVTLQTLSLAEAGIGEGDLSPVVVASSAPAGAGAIAAPDDGDTTTTSVPRRNELSTPTTTPVAPTSTASAGGIVEAPTTSTSAPPTTTVAVAAPIWEARTVASGGGAVTVRVAPSVVEFVSAVPAPGFTVEVDDDGPTRVRVEFESETERYEVRIEWDGSELLISTD